MSGDPEQEYFVDGIVEDIITGLSRIRWLHVARNSTFTYKGRAVDLNRGVRDAQDAANAAKDAASAAHVSADAQWRMAATMARPRIRVRFVSLDKIYEAGATPFAGGQPIKGRFEIVNVGSTDAHVQIWRCHLIIGVFRDPPEWPLGIVDHVRPITLWPGTHAELACQPSRALNPEEATNLQFVGRTSITVYAYGRIAYTDDGGAHRHTGFCRYWAKPIGTDRPRFFRLEEDEYEYED